MAGFAVLGSLSPPQNAAMVRAGSNIKGTARLLVRDANSFEVHAKLQPSFSEGVVTQLLVNSLTVWVISAEARVDIFA